MDGNFLLSKVLGTFPYKSTKNGYRVSAYLVVYNFVIILWVIADFSFFVNFVAPSMAMTNVQSLVIITEKLSSILGATVPVFMIASNVARINSVQRRIRILDRLLASINIHPRSYRYHSVGVFLIANIFFAVFIEGDFSKGRMRIISTLIMYSLLLGSALRIYHDVTAILCRSEAINEEMSKVKFELATSKNYTAEQTSNVADKIKKLHILCDCNESVCLLAETTNCMFSSQILLMLSISLVHAIIHTTQMSWSTHAGATTLLDTILFLVSKLAMVIVDVEMVAFVVVSCARVTDETRRFNVLLYQTMLFSKTSATRTDHKLRMNLISNWSVVFSAGGFFNVTYTLFQSLIGTAANFIFIIKQFG